MNKDNERLSAICNHEAGHAVASYLVGKKIEWLGADDKGGGCKSTGTVPLDDKILVSLAGIASVRKFFPEISVQLEAECRIDFLNAKGFLLEASFAPDPEPEIIEVSKRLEPFWEAIKELGEKLENTPGLKMSGEDVMEFLVKKIPQT